MTGLSLPEDLGGIKGSSQIRTRIVCISSTFAREGGVSGVWFQRSIPASIDKSSLRMLFETEPMELPELCVWSDRNDHIDLPALRICPDGKLF